MSMKRILLTMRSYVSGLLLCLVAVLSGCSADSEISYSDDLMTVPRAKMQVVELAQKYGLTVEVNDSLLAARVADGTFSLKKVEEMLQDFSGIIGVYPLTREGNSVRLNTRKERLLMKSRGIVLPNREETTDTLSTGSYKGHISKNKVSMDLKVKWTYNPQDHNDGGGKCTYEIENFQPETHYYIYRRESATIFFTGSPKTPTYSFRIICNPKIQGKDYVQIILNVSGNDSSLSVS